MIIVECILVVCAVLFYLWFGCFVGREFGSYENFVLKILDNVKNKHIAQQPLSGSAETASPKSAEPTSDNGKRCMQ